MDIFSKIKGKFSSAGTNADEFSDDYVEIDTKSAIGPKTKVIVRPFIVTDFADIKPALDSLREGYTIALINIKPLRDKDSEVKDLYLDLRDELGKPMENSILKKLNRIKNGGKLPSKPIQIEQKPATSGVFGFSWGKPALTKEIVEEKFNNAHEILEHQDKSTKGWTSLNLCGVIRSMPFQNEFNLSLKDFIPIHKKILEIKLTEASEPGRKFVGTYDDAIISYKSMSPKFRDWLFYDYDELIEAIRAKKDTYLKTLFSIEKR